MGYPKAKEAETVVSPSSLNTVNRLRKDAYLRQRRFSVTAGEGGFQMEESSRSLFLVCRYVFVENRSHFSTYRSTASGAPR
jgi:hypothetical protein